MYFIFVIALLILCIAICFGCPLLFIPGAACVQLISLLTYGIFNFIVAAGSRCVPCLILIIAIVAVYVYFFN